MEYERKHFDLWKNFTFLAIIFVLVFYDHNFIVEFLFWN
jgi:hypothetical protein